jgi:hypothetical protein
VQFFRDRDAEDYLNVASPSLGGVEVIGPDDVPLTPLLAQKGDRDRRDNVDAAVMRFVDVKYVETTTSGSHGGSLQRNLKEG